MNQCVLDPFARRSPHYIRRKIFGGNKSSCEGRVEGKMMGRVLMMVDSKGG